MAMKKETVYFEKPGRDNTAKCLEIVADILKREGYGHIVVASTSGSTGLLFSDFFRDSGANLVVVTHSAGFKSPNTFEMPEETSLKIKENRARIFTGTILTHSIETSLSSKFSGIYPAMIIAQSLRRFGEGAKVCCEIVMMAADAGLVPEGEEVVAVAGTASGADTVMVVKSAASKRFLELRVLEILAKPRLS